MDFSLILVVFISFLRRLLELYQAIQKIRSFKIGGKGQTKSEQTLFMTLLLLFQSEEGGRVKN